MINKKRRRLLVSVMAFSLTVILGVLILLGLFINHQSKKESLIISEIYMKGLSSQMTRQLTSLMDLYFVQAQTLTSVDEDKSTSTDNIRERIRKINGFLGFENVALIDEDGNTEILVGEELTLCLSESINLLFRSELKAGRRMAAAGDPHTSGKRQIVFGIPASYKMQNGANAVGLAATIPAEKFLSALLMNVDNNIVDIMIVNREGNFVLRKEREGVESYYDYMRKTDVGNSSEVEDFISTLKDAMEKRKDFGSVISKKDDSQYIFCRSIADSEWYFVSVLPYGTLNNAVSSINSQNSVAEIVTILIIIGVLILILEVYLWINKQQLIEVEKARNEAIRANKAKSEFLSNMSHDIRTPMNAIQGMTAIATAHLDNTDQVKHCLAKISLAGRHLLGLINDILDMSKIESGKMSLNIDRASLRDIMDSIVGIAQPQMKVKNQRFEIFIRNIISEYVYCDAVRLNQVILNLMSNAIKFTPEEGKITISMTQSPSKKGDNFVTVIIHVVDTGIGIDPKFKDSIWEAFTREDNSRVHKIQGSGLGMAITRYIVDKMEGEVTFESELGKGTDFCVKVDLEKAPSNDNEVMKFDGGDVLVVDDDKELCESAMEVLREFGLNPESTLDGESSIELAMERHKKGNDYKLILMDWMLPGMNGIETVWQLRNQIGNEVPIILITAYDWMDFEGEARKAGITGFISKPLFKSTLYHGIKPFLKKEEAIEVKKESTGGLKGLKILLAEDNEINKEVAEALLEDQGITIDWAENGSLAVEKFSEMPEGYYDAILMDLRMPVMDGYEATEHIRRLSRRDSNIPILAMTADAFSEDVQRCLDVGMNAHISKPIDIKKLMQALEEHLSKK